MGSEMTGTYNVSLVAVSFASAVVASYIALDLASRVQSASKWQLFWFLGGAVAMGSGIWSMHFVAVLAFQLPQSVNYSVWITFVSLGCGISASGIALWLLSLSVPKPPLLIGGVCMGIAIAGMHYTGMAAMRLQARIEYDWRLVGLSVIIAISTSFVALWLASPLQNESLQRRWQKLKSAAVMGVAISGTHYTGMWATHFIPQATSFTQSPTFDQFWLGITISIATLIILDLALIASVFNQRLAVQQMHITSQKQVENVLRRSAERERAIAKVIQQIRQTLDIETIFAATTQELRQAIKCDRVLIYRFNPDWSGEFVFESVAPGWKILVQKTIQQPELTQAAVNKAGCVAKMLGSEDDLIQDTYLQETQGGIYSQGKSYACAADIYQSGFTPCYIELLESFQARAYITVPILCGNQLWGLLAAYQNSGPRSWEAAEIMMIVQIGTQVGVAIQQAELLAKTQRQAEELRKAKEAADTANRAKSNFLASMSHELRTPLNAILGFTQLINRERALTPEHQRYLDIISHSGEHLLRLINDVLEMSKIEAGRTALHEINFDLHRLLDTLEDMLQLRARAKGLQLIFNCDPDLPRHVKTDENKLRQVLINLLENAIKFTQTGSVTLRVSVVSGKRLTTGDKLTIHFEVKDTGPGIAPGDLKKLFEPFEQTETGLKSIEGTGLGLTISQNFVQLMGGEITVSSQLGVGSIFRFDIQITLADQTVVETNQLIGRKVIGLAPGQSTYRILVAEDDPTNSLLLVKLLNALGFQVREAKNGQEALQVWEQWEPHLIWMDMRMPVMDGYEVTERIKASLKGQATIVIALTASAFEEQRQKSLLAGCDDFLRKPSGRDELLAKLSQHLGVQYIYEANDEAKIIKAEQYFSSSFILQPADLQVMPDLWVEQLCTAALQCSDSLIFELIEQIPKANSSLAIALKNLAENFLFDQVATLAQQAKNREINLIN